jgi:transglutaminase-like putative cysteine protease
MQFQIIHHTQYLYSAGISISHHVARMTPRALATQQVIEHRLEVNPAPGVVRERIDYFGNGATYFTIEQPHGELSLTARSRVEVIPSRLPQPDATPGWESVAHTYATNRRGRWTETEFVLDSPMIERRQAWADYARESFPGGRPILAGVLALTGRIHRDFTFDPGATSVATPLDEVFERRRGVCQDFAHFLIACLRSLELPARYVSGYLETMPPPGSDRLMGVDASHAWVSAFVPGSGWVDVDPTNNLLVADRHVTVGWGRDYSDVSPLRGLVMGGGTHSLHVAVDVIRVGPPL